MITATITTDKYEIKKTHHIKSLSNIRLIVPKNWDVDYVNIMLWEEDIAKIKNNDDGTFEIIVPMCGEIFLKKVIKDDRRHYVLLPKRYDEEQVLILPI